MQPKLTNAERRTRGRPKKITYPAPRFFVNEFSPERVKKLSESISRTLGIPTSRLTIELAHVALAYVSLRELCKLAPMKTGCTNRPKIHRDVLMRDVAVVYGRFVNSNPSAELGKINYTQEQKSAGNIANGIACEPPLVEAAARAVLSAVEEKYFASLRRPARNARRLLASDFLP